MHGRFVERTDSSATFECEPSFVFPDSATSSRQLLCTDQHIWNGTLPDCVGKHRTQLVGLAGTFHQCPFEPCVVWSFVSRVLHEYWLNVWKAVNLGLVSCLYVINLISACIFLLLSMIARGRCYESFFVRCFPHVLCYCTLKPRNAESEARADVQSHGTGTEGKLVATITLSVITFTCIAAAL